MQQKMKVLFTILVLLSLSLTTAGGVQAQGPDPWQKKMPLGDAPPEAVPSGSGTLKSLPLGEPNLIDDPSFEDSFPHSPHWYTDSTNFGTALCTLSACGMGAGTAGPRTGNVWAWFGGIPAYEHALVSQIVIFPECGATLQFYFWIGATAPGSYTDDRFIVRVGDRQIFTVNATQKSSYSAYTLVSLNLNSFADGNAHELVFESYTSGQLVTFNLDDISLVSGPCVTISGDAGRYGTGLSYTNVSPRLAMTDADGNYSFKVPMHWTGRVTPLAGVSEAFSPASRTYTNLTTDQTGQDYIHMYALAGNAGVAGATLSYMDGTLKTGPTQANGSYSLWVPDGWTGTITPSHPCFTFNPASRSYANYSGYQNFEHYTPSFNSGAGCANIDLLVGGTRRGWFGLLPGASTRVSFAGVNSGPVKLQSTNAVPVIGAERLIYKVSNVATSFTEMMALPNGQLDTTYWLPWYNNVDLDTQLRFANVSGSPASVHVYIGGEEMTGSPFTLAVGESTRKSFAGVNDGPVQIVSDHGVPIVAAERLIYKVNGVAASFSETMAVPNSQLNTTYWLPWYNNAELDTQLRFANVTDQTATVHVYIGGDEMPGSPFTLLSSESTRKSFAGINAGPVQIVSDVPIVAAERLIYKVNNVATSFTEMMALPNSSLDTTYWLPWYNNKELDTQLRFANTTNTPASVHIYIGGQEMQGSPFILASGESTRKSFANINNGPVQIVSDVPIVAAERLIYKVNNIATSFSEMMALPASQLDTTYWLPWYNNVELDTQLRFGIP